MKKLFILLVALLLASCSDPFEHSDVGTVVNKIHIETVDDGEYINKYYLIVEVVVPNVRNYNRAVQTSIIIYDETEVGDLITYYHDGMSCLNSGCKYYLNEVEE